MIYRRRPRRNRKYVHSNVELNPIENPVVEALKEAIEIPLPKEMEYAAEVESDLRSGRKPSFLGSIFKHIHVEEIILLGLIFLLLDEKIEDDFLLVILIYILISGND